MTCTFRTHRSMNLTVMVLHPGNLELFYVHRLGFGGSGCSCSIFRAERCCSPQAKAVTNVGCTWKKLPHSHFNGTALAARYGTLNNTTKSHKSLDWVTRYLFLTLRPHTKPHIQKQSRKEHPLASPICSPAYFTKRMSQAPPQKLLPNKKHH